MCCRCCDSLCVVAVWDIRAWARDSGDVVAVGVLRAVDVDEREVRAVCAAGVREVVRVVRSLVSIACCFWCF